VGVGVWDGRLKYNNDQMTDFVSDVLSDTIQMLSSTTTINHTGYTVFHLYLPDLSNYKSDGLLQEYASPTTQ